MGDKKLPVEHSLFLQSLTMLHKSSYSCKSRMHIPLGFELYCEKCFSLNFDHVTKIQKKQKGRTIEFQTIYFSIDSVKMFNFFFLYKVSNGFPYPMTGTFELSWQLITLSVN